MASVTTTVAYPGAAGGVLRPGLAWSAPEAALRVARWDGSWLDTGRKLHQRCNRLRMRPSKARRTVSWRQPSVHDVVR